MNYLTLNSEIIKSKKSGTPSEELLKIFAAMSHDFVDNIIVPVKKNSISVEDKEDIRMFALVQTLKYWNNFDPTRFTSPKKYIFTIMKSSLANWINKKNRNPQASYSWTKNTKSLRSELTNS